MFQPSTQRDNWHILTTLFSIKILHRDIEWKLKKGGEPWFHEHWLQSGHQAHNASGIEDHGSPSFHQKMLVWDHGIQGYWSSSYLGQIQQLEFNQQAVFQHNDERTANQRKKMSNQQRSHPSTSPATTISAKSSPASRVKAHPKQLISPSKQETQQQLEHHHHTRNGLGW